MPKKYWRKIWSLSPSSRRRKTGSNKWKWYMIHFNARRFMQFYRQKPLCNRNIRLITRSWFFNLFNNLFYFILPPCNKISRLKILFLFVKGGRMYWPNQYSITDFIVAVVYAPFFLFTSQSAHQLFFFTCPNSQI